MESTSGYQGPLSECSVADRQTGDVHTVNASYVTPMQQTPDRPSSTSEASVFPSTVRGDVDQHDALESTSGDPTHFESPASCFPNSSVAYRDLLRDGEMQGIIGHIRFRKFKDALESLQAILASPADELKPLDYLRLLSLKFYCQMRLHEAHNIVDEVRSMGGLDAPYWTFECHPDLYPGRRGSMVPFCLRILHAMAPHASNKTVESINLLHKLLELCRSNLPADTRTDDATSGQSERTSYNESVHGYTSFQMMWLARLTHVAFLLALLLVSFGYSKDAVQLLQDEILTRRPQHVPTLSLTGRILLKMGCCESAEQYFGYAECVQNGDSTTTCTNKGLLLIANRDFTAACAAMDTAWKLSRKSFPSNAHENTSESTNDFATFPTPEAVCSNNLAVCNFYSKRLMDATIGLESLLKGEQRNVFSTGVRNILTLYEFAINRDECLTCLDDVLMHVASEDPEITLMLSRVEA